MNYHNDLKNICWNKEIAKKIAKKELINMTPDHWKVVYAIRNFYLEFNITPSMRILMKILKKKLKI
ncbi:MAG: TusE/DsrC/DsvC family sulfur relay protein [Buchnera aphidicola (Schlechtendalia peitan)]